MANRPRAFSGARAVLVMDGKIVGYMTDCNGGEQIQQMPIDVCGDVFPLGHEPVGVTTNFSAGFVAILDTDMVAQGVQPGATTTEIMDWPEMDALIKDVRDPDKVLFKVEGVAPTSRTFNLSARALCQRQASWGARKMKEGSEA